MSLPVIPLGAFQQCPELPFAKFMLDLAHENQPKPQTACNMTPIRNRQTPELPGADLRRPAELRSRIRPLRLFALLLLTLPGAAQAQFNYMTNGGGITITGYAGPGGAATIPSTINGLPVAGIGNSAFSGAGLTSATIPDSVTSIGDSAFNACWGLTSVTIPDSVTRIGDNAFDHCLSLTAVTIGNSVTSIGQSAFAFCRSLASVTIPDSVSSIGDMAFIGCASLNSFTIGNSVTNIGADAFNDCTGLTGLTIPGSVRSIGSHAFAGCSSLTGVHFQGNAPGIAVEVFGPVYGDNDLTVYHLPGTTGWGSTFAGLPTVLWNPQVQTRDAAFGVRTNQFGFTVTGASNLGVVVVEASTNLVNWSPLVQLTLTGGSSCFSDPQWTNYPARFYRLRWP